MSLLETCLTPPTKHGRMPVVLRTVHRKIRLVEVRMEVFHALQSD